MRNGQDPEVLAEHREFREAVDRLSRNSDYQRLRATEARRLQQAADVVLGEHATKEALWDAHVRYRVMLECFNAPTVDDAAAARVLGVEAEAESPRGT